MHRCDSFAPAGRRPANPLRTALPVLASAAFLTLDLLVGSPPARAAEPPPLAPETVDRIEQLLQAADEQLAANRPDQAVDAFQVAIGLDPSVRSWSLRKRLVGALLDLGPARCHEARLALDGYLALDGLTPEHRVWGEQVARPRLEGACPAVAPPPAPPPVDVVTTGDPALPPDPAAPASSPVARVQSAPPRGLVPALIMVGGTAAAGVGVGLLVWSKVSADECAGYAWGCVHPPLDLKPDGTALVVVGAVTDVVGIVVAIAEARRAPARADAAPDDRRPAVSARPIGGFAPTARGPTGWVGITGAF